jgi:predicted nucleotidyltransferase component of viral defense system
LKARKPTDRAASVRARLLNLARDRAEDFQITLRNYLFERFLYRLSRSELRERFVLKGAMLLRLWADQPYRATVDLDLLWRGNDDPNAVARDIAAICRTPVPEDVVVFDARTISVEPIRAQEEYAGVRAMLDAQLARSVSGCRWMSGSAMRSGRAQRRWRIPWHWAIQHR